MGEVERTLQPGAEANSGLARDQKYEIESLPQMVFIDEERNALGKIYVVDDFDEWMSEAREILSQ